MKAVGLPAHLPVTDPAAPPDLDPPEPGLPARRGLLLRVPAR